MPAARNNPATRQPDSPNAQVRGFFNDEGGAGIQFVQALDRSHAKDIMRATHPEGPLCVMAADLVEGQDLHDLLRSWLNRQG